MQEKLDVVYSPVEFAPGSGPIKVLPAGLALDPFSGGESPTAEIASQDGVVEPTNDVFSAIFAAPVLDDEGDDGQ